jgi:hypothetical protein
MTQMNEQEEVCVCGLPQSQHANTIHPFARQGGDPLQLPEKPKPETDRVIKRDGAQNQSMARLLGVLLDKGVIDEKDIANIVGIPTFKDPA